jgi:photosystem II stability/assembly factor-like uncharacterized protein
MTFFSAFVSLLIGLESGSTREAGAPREVIYRSIDYGQTWSPMTQNLPPETEVSFMERRGNRIIMASDNTGIFISDDEKQSWKQIGNGLPGKKIKAFHLSGNEIYAGVYQQGVYVSRDDGAAWQSLNAGLRDLSVRAILRIGGELLVATDTGIFKKSSGQKEWTQPFSGFQVISLNEDQGKIIAGCVQGLLLSADGGDHWGWVLQEGAAHNTSILEGRVFVMNISGDLFVSQDWGQTWSKSAYAPREGSYVYEMVNAGETLVMSNNYGIHRSSDGGRAWELIFPTEEFIFFDLLFFDQTIYAGTRTWNEYRKKSK